LTFREHTDSFHFTFLLSLPRSLPQAPKANGIASSTAAPTTTTTMTADDSDAERLSKKQRASSFVPEAATPQPGGTDPSTPVSSAAIEKSLEAANEKITSNSNSTNNASNGNGTNNGGSGGGGGGGRGTRGGKNQKKQNQQNQSQQQQNSIQQAGAGGESSVSVPGLETSLPAGEMNGLAQAVMNGGAENEAAVMMGEQPTA